MNLIHYVGARGKNALRFAWRRLHGFAGDFGQDRWVIEEVFHRKRGGYFVDLGAYDGYIASNTYVLERRFGWKGICIEAHPVLFKKLLRNRRCRCVQACVAAEEGTAQFLEKASAWGGIVDQYPAGRRAQLMKFLRPRQLLDGDNYRTMTVKTVPLASVLRENGAPRTIDYLSLDTEGSEYDILRTFPFDEFRFRAISVEHNRVERNRAAIRALLVKNGYRFVREAGIDDLYVYASLDTPAPAGYSG